MTNDILAKKVVFFVCRVKEGVDVRTLADLQNLVTSVILRQDGVFTKEELKDTLESKLSGSHFVQEEEPNALCERTFNMLRLAKYIRSTDDGYYLAAPLPSYPMA